MNNEERNDLIKFCILARADIEGVEIDSIEADKYIKMSDEELSHEAVWLDELLGK